jgi:hypothetical protein
MPPKQKDLAKSGLQNNAEIRYDRVFFTRDENLFLDTFYPIPS